MLKAFRNVLTLVALIVLSAGTPSSVRADDKPLNPSVLVRVQSINDLIKSVEFFAAFAGEDAGEQIKQGIGFAKALIDDKKGLEGIDVKSPIGLYATLTPEVLSSPVVALIPVADEETILDALKNRAQLEIKKNKDGVYETTPPNSPMTVYFRFANKYAYITTNDPENIAEKKLPKPADILGGAASDLLSITLRLDRLPDQMKTMAIGAIENQLAQGKEQPLPEETKAIKAFRDASIDQITTTIKELLKEGEGVAIKLKVDTQSEEVGLEIEVGGVKGSKLAKDIMSIRENKSVVGGALSSSNAIMALNLSTSLSASLKKLFPPVVDDVLKLAIEKSNAPGEVQEMAKPLIEALKPTLKAGDLDAGMSLVGPNKDGKVTALIGLKLTEGLKIESAVKDLVKKLPPEIAGMFKLDAEKLAGGAMLHSLKIPETDPKFEKLFGKSDAHLSFRNDLLVLAIGPDAKDIISKAVASKPGDVGITQFQISLAKFLPVVAETGDEAAVAKKIAEKLFKDGSKNDKMKISIEGGDTLRIKFAINGKAIQFLAEMGLATQKKDN